MVATYFTRHAKLSINEIQARMRATGSHWWDADTMGYFGTKVKSPVYSGPGGHYFVTRDGTGFDWKEKNSFGYTVRSYNETSNDIRSVLGIAKYETYEEAEDVAIRAAHGPDEIAAKKAVIAVDSTSHNPATPVDDLRLALSRNGVTADDRDLKELIRLARNHEQACVDYCNGKGTGKNIDTYERFISKLLKDKLSGIKPSFNRDPRGCTVKLILPNGETNDFAKTGYCVPVGA